MQIKLSHIDFPRQIVAVTSKSVAHRMLICAAFCNYASRFKFKRVGEDIHRTIDCLCNLGAGIEKMKESENGDLEFTLHPIRKLPEEAVLDCGESGSTLRFFLPLCASLGVHATYLRKGRLSQRPLTALETLLSSHGVSVYEDDDNRLHTEGRLEGRYFELPGNISSQFVSGMIFAMCVMTGESTLRITSQIESAPYIDLTLSMVGRYGIKTEREGQTIRVEGVGPLGLRRPRNYMAEGDWSGAAVFLSAGAIGSHSVSVSGLKIRTSQGDREIIKLLKSFGAKVYKQDENTVTVAPGRLHGITIDASDIPDLVPVLACVGAAASGTTRIEHAGRLRLKESDRLAVLSEMLTAVGVPVTEMPDGLEIHGTNVLRSAVLSAHHDHRMAMAAALLALWGGEDCEIVLDDAESVSKSWPGFWSDLGLTAEQ
ncbi:MAG: 3-phosphoshikimate 1-carboxyvinyltransferase [Clostridia bacterium]|nr:3-phosphoshikimate 1-carboxyvinyltransferase [Clostridia bacterium]